MPGHLTGLHEDEYTAKMKVFEYSRLRSDGTGESYSFTGYHLKKWVSNYWHADIGFNPSQVEFTETIKLFQQKYIPNLFIGAGIGTNIIKSKLEGPYENGQYTATINGGIGKKLKFSGFSSSVSVGLSKSFTVKRSMFSINAGASLNYMATDALQVFKGNTMIESQVYKALDFSIHLGGSYRFNVSKSKKIKED
jgi:hypothetical protein